MKRLNRIHLGWNLFLWASWAVGIILVVVGREDISFFWNVAEPYNRIAILGSLVPIEPALFISTMIAGGKRKEPFKRLLPHCILPVVTFFLFIMYVVTYVAWTGGV